MDAPAGLLTVPSPYPVDATVAKLKAAIAARGLTLFAEIDHDGGAARAGLSMPPARVLIFGNPKAGTPLMVARPLLALDLPLKVLVWAEPEGRVSVSYSSPEFLAGRYSLPAEMAKAISGVGPLVAAALASEGRG
jgi:uncharacterized protein (DUF302 family)